MILTINFASDQEVKGISKDDRPGSTRTTQGQSSGLQAKVLDRHPWVSTFISWGRVADRLA